MENLLSVAQSKGNKHLHILISFKVLQLSLS